ncbi:MAG TPA: hypothetical protein VJ807_08100 [Gaiellaceae bacterium]|nr:hypothetical protein [Gaiellaceae bacterium]
MKRLFLALSVVALLLLTVGVGTAAAQAPSQDTGQLAASGQDALGAAGTAQQGPSNSNEPVRVLSPGDSGPVSQSNEASSNASAGNVNATGQSADQTQSGGGLQAIGQSANNAQDAVALAFTIQQGASNENAPVGDLSPGASGPVTQSNDASSDAEAGNLNGTEQTADQTQAGADSCKCGSGGDQVIGQAADNSQQAGALAATVQEKPSNENISVRVLSPGNDGPVTQSNTASSDAAAANLNGTEQAAGQSQAGGAGSQLIGQAADSEQKAGALAATVQEKPSNTNVNVRVLSPGSNGPVTQSNDASSNATAANLNGTTQEADQTQSGDSCKCGSAGSQQIGQLAKSDQEAKAAAVTEQHGASNKNVDVRVLSPGDGGPVSQSNTASSNAEAANKNGTYQSADQTQTGNSCKCQGGLQAIGQFADNDQKAGALAATVQVKPSNENISVRVLSPGNDGPVSQTNEATSNAEAGNLNATKQDATQAQSGPGLQVIGQAAKNEQDAFAIGLTFQIGASNENAPVRVLSPGNGGPVSQSNIASSDATAGNVNWTDQAAGQRQAGGMSCCHGVGIQAIGQLAQNEQGAVALAATFQLAAKQPCRCDDDSNVGNSNEPKRVLSPGDDGAVRQLNKAASDATAVNWNVAKQDAFQAQAGDCRCKSDGIQALGQLSDSRQFAFGLAAGLQLKQLNEWAPDRKDSPGRNADHTQLRKHGWNDMAGSGSSTDQSKTQVEGR